MKRIFIALLYLCLFVMIVSCATVPASPSETVNTPPTTSGEHLVPSGPLTTETSATDLSEPFESSEPFTSIPKESEEPDIQPTPEELLWAKRWEEYPVATEVWLIMKSYGWTDAACAGIMGNMMREVGGGTLKLDPNLRYGSHYGLCQWTSRYYQEIFPREGWAPSVYEQVAFLRHTILTYDRIEFPYDFTEEYLLTATDYREVAKKFCDGYERPAENSTRREKYAEKAWKYFVLREELEI